MNVMKNYYAILGISESSSYEDKKSYHNLIRKHHPDKSDYKLKPSLERFLLIEEAWKILRDQQARAIYDAKKILVDSKYRKPVHEELNLKDLKHNTAERLYREKCRCGGWFSLHDEDVRPDGIIAMECNDCSLSLFIDCDKT